ncbi:MAG: hypothetical protein AAFQ39_16105, partial [Pseudomonadota bacterium]
QSVLATRPVAYFFTFIGLSIASDKGLGAKPGDYRDIPAIQAWALEAFATQLSPNDRSHP